MGEHPIQGMMDTTMEKIKQMVDVDTIVGTPINVDEKTVLIPISKVTYGFAAGGSDLPVANTQKELFGGGSGAGITINPIGVIAVCDGDVKMLNIITGNNSTDKAIAMVPELIDKIAGLFDKNKSKKQSSSSSDSTNI